MCAPSCLPPHVGYGNCTDPTDGSSYSSTLTPPAKQTQHGYFIATSNATYLCDSAKVTRSRVCTPNLANPASSPYFSSWDYSGA